jgi:hypothetical protein
MANVARILHLKKAEGEMMANRNDHRPAAEAGKTAPAAGLATRRAGASCFPGEMPGGEGIMTMSLADFLNRMKNGWGFVYPLYVTELGRVLRAVVEALGLNQDYTVEVDYARSTRGSGTDFHYEYRWIVRPWGITLHLEWGKSFIRGDKYKLELGYDD